MKWSHLCSRGLKWSQEAIKEVELTHIHSQMQYKLLTQSKVPETIWNLLSLLIKDHGLANNLLSTSD